MAVKKATSTKKVTDTASAKKTVAKKTPVVKASTKVLTKKTSTKAPVRKRAAAVSDEVTHVNVEAENVLAPAKKVTKKNKSTPTKKNILVIVESPAKAKTIEKYLGKDYSVLASMGHLIDLPKSRLGVDLENNFEPEYLTIHGKAKLLKELQKAAAKSRLVLLASDNDREGEAIAYHLQKALKDKNADLEMQRIVFNEITPQAIRDAVQNMHAINIDKVEAQKARRVLDRLVGYYLSPLLWKKVKSGLSAGRVQSVALRLVCAREKEVEDFIPEEYWTIETNFQKGRSSLAAQLVSYKGDKPELANADSAAAVIKNITGAEAKIADVRETEKTIRPKAPFTTSKLQQAAANRLGFTSRKTMQLAQQLYEGVNIGRTRIGLITYMRTDSTRISPVAIEEVRNFLHEKYPNELPSTPNNYVTNAKAQDAHEAIRPTVITYTPDEVKEALDKDQFKLYSLIWETFVASQMNNAKSQTVTVDVAVGEAVFRASSTFISEQGFYKVLKYSATREDKISTGFPALSVGESLKYNEFKPEQHFTQGPARFTDASIIKTLEEQGIGRPSTYAPIISVLLERYYVTREAKQLKPTTLGRLIDDMLNENFSNILEPQFTAKMEAQLDSIEDHTSNWRSVIGEFFNPFKVRVEEVSKNLESQRGSLDELTDIICEKCGKPFAKKLGRFGYFLACTGFPDCRNTRSIPLAKCPRCKEGDIIARKKVQGRGREFYGCTRYPECDFISYQKPTNINCPKCGEYLVEKTDKKNGTHKACVNPNCDYLHSQDDEKVTVNQ